MGQAEAAAPAPAVEATQATQARQARQAAEEEGSPVTALARLADHVWDLLPAAVFLALMLGGAA